MARGVPRGALLAQGFEGLAGLRGGLRGEVRPAASAVQPAECDHLSHCPLLLIGWRSFARELHQYLEAFSAPQPHVVGLEGFLRECASLSGAAARKAPGRSGPACFIARLMALAAGHTAGHSQSERYAVGQGLHKAVSAAFLC